MRSILVRCFLRAAQLGLFSSLHPALEKSNVLEALGACRDDSVQPDEWLAALFAPLSIAEGEAVIDRLRLSGRRATLARDTIGLAARERQIGLAAGSRSELFRLLVDFRPGGSGFSGENHTGRNGGWGLNHIFRRVAVCALDSYWESTIGHWYSSGTNGWRNSVPDKRCKTGRNRIQRRRGASSGAGIVGPQSGGSC